MNGYAVHDMDARFVSVFVIIGLLFFLLGLFLFPGPLNDRQKIERFDQFKTIWMLILVVSVIYGIIQVFKGC